MMQMFKVLEPGAYTTIQDRGRLGYQQFGVPITGPVDEFAFRLANLLVGNSEDAAALELTVLGPSLRVLGDADVAVTGAQMPVHRNDELVPVWISFRVKPGDTIRVRMARNGCRSYLAVSGGIDVPVVMGSRSTYVGAKLGGIEGRPIMKGDVINRGESDLLHAPRRTPVDLVPDYPNRILVRAMAGPQDYHFDEGHETFFNEEFVVTSKADRMGYRLEGPVIKPKEGAPFSIISEPSVPGGVQIPPDGQPIIVLVEQTSGGYSKIATVVSSDIRRVAQAKPGDRIRFELVDLETAHSLFRRQEDLLQRTKELFAT